MLDRQEVLTWIADDPDVKTAQEVADLLALADDGDSGALAELEDRFSGMLEFGTAGLRGRMGGGPHRMNRAVVMRAAAGLTSFLRETLPDGFTVVIGYDARYGSKQFAKDTAAIVEGGGGHALLFDSALPTPLTAFAVRHFNADAAVMVTASHNPAQDNGYKVYLGGRVVSDAGQGVQIVPPFDALIFEAISKVSSLAAIPTDDTYDHLGPEVVDAYLKRLEEIVPSGPRDLRIVVTSMHGVGGEIMLSALDRLGFTDVHFVAEQQDPDPDFPTVQFPNPEEPGALDLAFALARQVDADIILANDPDADRCSAAIPDPNAPEGWRQLTGNEVGSLLGQVAAVENSGDKTAVMANSVVSSRLVAKIAAKYHVTHRRTLTGFKWIARVPGLVYGFEEALGYCVDPSYVRDKDGIAACSRLAGLAAEQKAKGRTLQTMLDDFAREFGLHASAPLTVRVEDLSLIATSMENLRAHGVATIAGSPVVTAIDLSEGSDDLPPTDGLLYLTEAEDQVVVRPSGTEPKLKCYIEVIVPVGDSAEIGDQEQALASAHHLAEQRLTQIKTDMRQAMGI